MALYALGGWGAVVWGGAVRQVLMWHVTWLVNRWALAFCGLSINRTEAVFAWRLVPRPTGCLALSRCSCAERCLGQHAPTAVHLVLSPARA